MLKKLSIFLAKQIAKEHLSKIQDEESRDFHKIHEKLVVKCSKILAKNKRVNKKKLEIACWLHDIGRSISEENHPEHSLKILESENYEVDEIVRDCILNHGRSGNPLTQEGKIIQIADKLSVISPEIIKILEKYSFKKSELERKKDLEMIKKMANSGIESLESWL